MTERVEIKGGATADETAAILVAIALVLEEERQRGRDRDARSPLSPWVRLGRFADPGGVPPTPFPGH